MQYLVPALDVCPPVQEDIDGPEMAFLSSTVESRTSILADTKHKQRYMNNKQYYI
jgi:hypothetical protein